jgi:hypothetical protein
MTWLFVHTYVRHAVKIYVEAAMAMAMAVEMAVRFRR